MNGKAAVLIGSDSDRDIIESSRKYFEYFNIEMDLRVLSAHRNPKDVSDFASTARAKGHPPAYAHTPATDSDSRCWRR